MSIQNKVVSIVTRARVISTATELAKSNVIDPALYENALAAIGQQFTEDFGVNCQVTITFDKEALEERLKLVEPQNV